MSTVLSSEQVALLGHAERVQRVTESLAATRDDAPGSKVSDDAHVYFIQRGETGPVKIGCSANVARRFWELQTGSAEPLRLLGIAMLGGYSMEARLHRMFAHDRISGEWFRPSQLLLEIASDSIGDGR